MLRALRLNHDGKGLVSLAERTVYFAAGYIPLRKPPMGEGEVATVEFRRLDEDFYPGDEMRSCPAEFANDGECMTELILRHAAVGVRLWELFLADNKGLAK